MRWLVLPLLAAAWVAGGCSDEVKEYEIIVSFDVSVTQDHLNEVEALFRAYDQDLEFLVQESFPPTGRAFVETSRDNICHTVETELGARFYVDAVRCVEADDEPVENPDEPVSSG